MERGAESSSCVATAVSSSYKSSEVLVINGKSFETGVLTGNDGMTGRSLLLDGIGLHSDLPEMASMSNFGGSGISVTEKTWKSFEGMTLFHEPDPSKIDISMGVSGINVMPTCI